MLCLLLLTGAAVLAGSAAAMAQGVINVDEFAAKVRRSGIDKVVDTWVRETSVDYFVWMKRLNDKSPDASRLVKRLRAAAEQAAKQLDEIACDGDPNLPAYAVRIYADKARVAPEFVTSKIFTVTCRGHFLQVTVKQPSTP